jgi:hypothetical protein
MRECASAFGPMDSRLVYSIPTAGINASVSGADGGNDRVGWDMVIFGKKRGGTVKRK